MLIFIVLMILFIVFKFLLKKWFFKMDNLIVFTGGIGSGKTYNAFVTVRQIYRKMLRKICVHNIFHKNKLPLPVIYSNIIFDEKKIHKKCVRCDLKKEHLLLVEKLQPNCIVFMDEISTFCNQFDYKNPNILDNFDEFMRLFRHYTLGGYFVGTEQCSENIVLQIRRRINQVYNMRCLKVWFGLIYTCEKRLISISEEIKTIEDGDNSESFKRHIGIALPKKLYNTYCFSARYDGVPVGVDTVTTNPDLKQIHFVECPKHKINKLVFTDEPDEHVENNVPENEKNILNEP